MTVEKLLPFLREAIVYSYTDDFIFAREYVRTLFPDKQNELADIVSFDDLRKFMDRDKNRYTMYEHGITNIYPSKISFELHNEYVKQFEIISITADDEACVNIKVKLA